MEFHNGFESMIIFNNKQEKISKENHYDISFNKNIGFIEDYFNFSNNNISIHLLKKKYEKSSNLNSDDFNEINDNVIKLIERFEMLDLKKFSMPVVNETLASFIEESKYNPSKIEDNKDKKTNKPKYLYFLLLVLFYIDRIKTKLLEDYKILLLLNKIKIPLEFEEVMKKENFYENYYNPLANLLSEFYVKNEIIAFYVKLINIYFTKTVLKHNNNSEIDNYTVKPKLLVEKSLIKLTAILAKKLAGFVLPCVKNILTLNPMFTMFASAVRIL